jgi:Fe-Mn family superoxide dismutase
MINIDNSTMEKYELPKLPYGYNELEPHISEEVLKIHHNKHHKGYVDGANALLDKLDKARKIGEDLDMKSTLKALAFNIGGHVLHTLFWENMAPKGGNVDGRLLESLNEQFGSVDRFKDEFTKAAASVEGSGWAVLALEKATGRLLVMQVEKHNVNVFPGFELLLVVDVWEHAYYLDYKNVRGDFLKAFWNVVNWEVVGNRLEKA